MKEWKIGNGKLSDSHLGTQKDYLLSMIPIDTQTDYHLSYDSNACLY